jgi:hypothetical protein
VLVVVRHVAAVVLVLEAAVRAYRIVSVNPRVHNDRVVDDVISGAAGQILRQIRVLAHAILAVLLLVVVVTSAAVGRVHVRL